MSNENVLLCRVVNTHVENTPPRSLATACGLLTGVVTASVILSREISGERDFDTLSAVGAGMSLGIGVVTGHMIQEIESEHPIMSALGVTALMNCSILGGYALGNMIGERINAESTPSE